MTESTPTTCQRNTDHWFRFGSTLACCALAMSAGAAGISVNSTMPSGGIVASQTTDLGPGTQNGANDFTDNGGPVGQAFTATTSSMVGSISMLGRGNAASAWNNGPVAFDGNQSFGILIGEIDGATGQLINTHMEEATGLVAPADITDWLTLTLDTPVSVTAGTLYGFSIAQWNTALGMYNNGGWFGFAHSDSDVYADGYALNANDSNVFNDSNTGAARYGFPATPYAAANTIGGGYDFAFVVQAVPEPTVLSLFGLGALGLLAVRRGRKQ